ncbi:MAG: hypothetical protein ACYC6L_13425 [Anaerolineae bacterium]
MNYYISNAPGSAGSNSNAGTSQDSAWRDFSPLHQRPLKPGDKVLLGRGSCWNQELVLQDSGAKDAWCELGAYGSGPRPKILRNMDAVERCVRMNDLSYWSVRDLEVGRAGVGIMVSYSTPGHEGLRFENIFAHDCYGVHVGWFPADGAARWQGEKDHCGLSSGIWVTCDPMDIGENEFVARDIVMDNVEGTYNADTIAFSPGGRRANTEGIRYYPFKDIVLNHLNFHDDIAPNPGGIPDTLRVLSSEHAVVLNSWFDNECGRHTNSGTAIVLMVGMNDLLYVNSSFTRTPDTGSHDQCAIDFESTNRNVRIRSCYFGQNAGPGVEFLDIWGEKCFSYEHEVSGSAFEGNGWCTHGGQGGSGGIHHYGGNYASAIIRDNLVYEPGRPLYHGEFINFTLKNNLQACEPMFNAIHTFGAQGENGWQYQVKQGAGAWTNLEQLADGKWSNLAGPLKAWISRFELCTLQADLAVARSWQAPRAGKVSVRASALKSYPTGANAEVQLTLNDAVIWGPQTCVPGKLEDVECHLDGVTVAAGDMLRFEVRGAAADARDAVSWAPTIAYLA